jgi:hypothetical protein
MPLALVLLWMQLLQTALTRWPSATTAPSLVCAPLLSVRRGVVVLCDLRSRCSSSNAMQSSLMLRVKCDRRE